MDTSIKASGICGSNLVWKLFYSGELVISGLGKMRDFSRPTGCIQTPWCNFLVKIASVIIEDGVTSIGRWAFSGCKSLESITIPSSVTSIGNCAFWNCKSLESITIPSNVTTIGHEVFLDCESLKSIQVAQGNTVFDSRENCNAIIETASNTMITGCQSTIVPEGITILGNGAFSSCKNLKSITLPSSVTSIGDYAFFGCGSLENINIPEGITCIGDSTFSCCFKLVDIVLPSSVTNIGYSAFSCCHSLVSIIIPEGVIRIGEDAFSGCENLEKVTLSRLTNIEKGAFDDCPKLINITNSIVAYGECGLNLKWTLRGTEELIISGRGEMSNYISDYRINVGPCAPWLDHSSSIKRVIVENGVTSIGRSAFCDSWIESILLPSTVTSIGDHAFYGCESLESITIPKSVTTIGLSAFSGCKSLKIIQVIQANSVYDSRENCNAIIEKFSNSLITGCQNTIIPSNVTSIGNEAFSWCKNLKSITIPESVTSIGDSAFSYCENLESITIPSSVTSIGDGAFSGCHRLKSVSIPESVTRIGDSAFSYCESLESITIPSSVTSIGDGAFSGCHCLKSVSIPESVITIGENAFSYCKSVENIQVAQGNKKYDSREKSNAIIETELNKLIAGCQNTIIPEGVTSIGDSAFGGCKSLESITIPEGVTSIGDRAFSYCESLESITVPSSVTSIGVLYDCGNLKSITCLATIPPSFDGADIPSSCVLRVPAESVIAYRKAKGWKTFVTIQGLPAEND